jgi:hypothetical protein
LAFLSVALIFIGNPSVEPIICMVAIERYCEITVPWVLKLKIWKVVKKQLDIVSKVWYCSADWSIVVPVIFGVVRLNDPKTTTRISSLNLYFFCWVMIATDTYTPFFIMQMECWPLPGGDPSWHLSPSLPYRVLHSTRLLTWMDQSSVCYCKRYNPCPGHALQGWVLEGPNI